MTNSPTKREPLLATFVLSALGLGIVYLYLSCFTPELNFLSDDGRPLITPAVQGIVFMTTAVVALLVVIDALWIRRVLFRGTPPGLREILLAIFSPSLFCVGLVVYLLSDIVSRRFSFFVDGGARIQILYAGLVLLAVILVRLRQRLPDLSRVFNLGPFSLLLPQVVITTLFVVYAEHRLIYSDDHPSFLYRLQLLLDHFPHIPFYNVDWNGGYSSHEYFATGVLNVFLLSYPIIRFFGDLSTPESSAIYTYLLPYLFVWIVPWSVWFAARILRLSSTSAYLAALLSLGPCMTFFEYLFKYGTVAFSLSAGLVPVTLALAMRLAVDEEEPKTRHIFFLFLAASLCLTWTLSAIAFIPAIGFALWNLVRHPSRRRWAYSVAFAMLFVAFHGAWIVTFAEQSRVLSFLSERGLPGMHGMASESESAEADVSKLEDAIEDGIAFGEINERADKIFRQSFVRFNPLVLFFAVPGMLLLPRGRMRSCTICTVIWLLGFGAFLDFVKPQLELRRMYVIACFLMTIPAGLAIEIFIRRSIESLAGKLSLLGLRPLLSGVGVIAVTGTLFLTPVTVGATYLNRSIERYVFAGDTLSGLSKAIREFGGEGRVFFLGFILHELESTNNRIPNGGHVAPLAAFSGKEMYGFHYYHEYWKAVEPIPKAYRDRDAAGNEEFLDLLNVSAVIAFKREWREYCEQRPERYQLKFSSGRFRLYSRIPPANGYFARGGGVLKRVGRHIVVTPADDDVLLKYRYLPKLRAAPSDGVTLSGELAFIEQEGRRDRPVEFIRIQGGKGREISLDF